MCNKGMQTKLMKFKEKFLRHDLRSETLRLISRNKVKSVPRRAGESVCKSVFEKVKEVQKVGENLT